MTVRGAVAGARARIGALQGALALGAVLLGALALRVWAFGGVSFGLGDDDGRYVAVAQNLAHGDLPHGAAEWFGTRVVFLWPVAGLFRLLGADDAVAVAWPLLGSLVSVVAAYLLGRDMVSRRVGLLAAGIVAAAPLEVLMATRLRPDAMMPGLVAMGVWCAYRARGRTRWAFAAGALLGAAWSVRESALVMAPVLVAAGWPAGRRALRAGLLGLGSVLGAVALLFTALGQGPLRPLIGTAEAGEWHDPVARWSLDGSYLAALVRGAADGRSVLVLALPVVATAAGVLLWRGDRRARLPLGWLALAALYLEVGTLPNLAKPTRFLTLCTIPAALLVATAAEGRLAALVVPALAALAVVALAPVAGREHRADDVVLLDRVVSAMRDEPRAPILAESYTWWAKLNAYLPRGRLPVARVQDPAFLDAAERRARRRLEPLPDPGAYRGGYVVTGPVHARSGWPSNWGVVRREMRTEVPWRRLVPVARVGDATVWRWPA
jgi:4-amino-4-deoxy-L-arabinose transferase-like glycosyltransferase